MKKYALNEITLMQYIFLNFGMVVSIGFLSLPRVLAELAGTAGWIALIIVWAISLVASLIVIQVMKRYPDGTLLDLLTVYLGKWAGKVGAVLFALYLFYYGYTGLVDTILITKQYLLQQTPAYIIKNKRKASSGIVISYTLTMLMYLFITVICFVYFSPDEIMEYNEPTINVLKAIEFKFIARIEVLFIAFYLLIFSLSWIPTMYMSVFCTTWLIGKQDHRNHLRLLWLFIAVGTYFFMPTFFQSERMNTLLGQIGFVVEYIVPVCLLLYLWIHERFGWRKHL